MSAWTKIQHIEAPSNQASIIFSSIPQTFTDLVIFYSLRTTGGSIDPQAFFFNSDSGPNYAMRMIHGDGNNTGSAQNSSYLSQYNNWAIFWMQPASTTANTFNNTHIIIPNYSATNRNKSVSVQSVIENNASTGYQQVGSGIWKSNSAINAITLTAYNSEFVQFTSASLYGITKGSSGGVTVS
jgi:hypothetical protein